MEQKESLSEKRRKIREEISKKLGKHSQLVDKLFGEDGQTQVKVVKEKIKMDALELKFDDEVSEESMENDGLEVVEDVFGVDKSPDSVRNDLNKNVYSFMNVLDEGVRLKDEE
jgi:hypothetical protein